MRTKREILELIEDEDIKFIRLQFTDMFGNLKNIAVTDSQLERVLNNRYTLPNSALFGEYPYGDEDVYLHPDLDSFVILPWRPQHGKVARFLCDVYKEDGTIYEMSSRTILKNVIKSAEEKGYTFYVDPDCEFFLFHVDENGIPTTVTHERAGYMDIGPIDYGENPRRDMVLALEEMGFEVESSHHETAPAQHEIDFKEAEPLPLADSMITFKSAVRSTAKRFGLHATFMPKPKQGIPGSGLHLNISVYKNGRNLFNDPTGNKETRDEAKWFMGGIMEHVNAMCAITNPLVNSYKRLMTGFDAPKDKVWTRKNVNALIKVRYRMGEDTKVDLRFPDPSANPYLAIAVCLAAGIDGIERKLDPGMEAPMCYEKLAGAGKIAGCQGDGASDVCDENAKCGAIASVCGASGKIGQLPGTLREAVAEMKGDPFIESVLGKEFADIYADAKMKEWNEYMEQISNWELNEYLYKI